MRERSRGVRKNDRGEARYAEEGEIGGERKRVHGRRKWKRKLENEAEKRQTA